MQSSSSFTLITTGRIETYQIATYSIRTLMKMDYCSPKHVELLNVMNNINHQMMCVLLDYIYIAKWYTVHTKSNSKNSDNFKTIQEEASTKPSPVSTHTHAPWEIYVEHILVQVPWLWEAHSTAQRRPTNSAKYERARLHFPPLPLLKNTGSKTLKRLHNCFC